jgi:hypothetical protein|tara:strand:+ start:3385 stop:4182 length:798 start_codon:yes stop_codon:yes gene_type:complete
MKRIYEFTVNKEETTKEQSVEKKKDGTEVTTAKDVVKEVPHKFFLRRPTRRMTDEAELYYGVKLAEGIKAGLLTRTLLEKRFKNDGGIRSDEDSKKYKSITDKLKNFYEEQTKILEIDEKKRTSSQKKRLKQLEKEVQPVRKELRNLQLQEDSLYEETAESRARNKVILWWMLHLAHAEQDGKDVEFFGSGDLEAKLKIYDDIDEGEDVFEIAVARRFAYYVSFWFVGRPNTQKEFQEMVDLALKLDEEETEEAEEAEKEEKTNG